MEIKKFTPKDHYVRCTIYGGSGVGKTVFWGTAPKAIFASSENGLLSINSTLGYSPDYVEIKTIEDMQDLYKFLKAGDHEYQTLVIDSLTEINDIIRSELEKTNKEMTHKQRGQLSTKIKGIIRGIKELPMHVIIICQEKAETDDDGKVTKVGPMLNGKNATEIAYLMDIVGYMYVTSTNERRITTAANEKLMSKDRTGKIGGNASLDFKDWIKAVESIAGPWPGETPKKVTPPKETKPTEPPQDPWTTEPPKEPKKPAGPDTNVTTTPPAEEPTKEDLPVKTQADIDAEVQAAIEAEEKDQPGTPPPPPAAPLEKNIEKMKSMGKKGPAMANPNQTIDDVVNELTETAPAEEEIPAPIEENPTPPADYPMPRETN